MTPREMIHLHVDFMLRLVFSGFGSLISTFTEAQMWIFILSRVRVDATRGHDKLDHIYWLQTFSLLRQIFSSAVLCLLVFSSFFTFYMFQNEHLLKHNLTYDPACLYNFPLLYLFLLGVWLAALSIFESGDNVWSKLTGIPGSCCKDLFHFEIPWSIQLACKCPGYLNNIAEHFLKYANITFK